MTRTASGPRSERETSVGLAPSVVVATVSDEKPVLLVDPPAAEMAMGALTGVASVWTAPADATVPSDAGEPSTDPGFAVAGQVKFGRSFIAPESVGTLDFTGMTDGPIVAGDDPSYHRTDTVDLGVVQHGEAELQLEDGSSTRLGPGSFFVVAGVQHRWRVIGDEPLVFAVFTLGARRAP